jgi:stage II sporulation protein AA (anti-sigma F factor antagonist)
MEFSCTASQIAGRVVLIVAGDVDLAAHPRFEADVAQSWDRSSDLVIECSQITFLDSMGLRVLVHTRQHAVENGREFALAAPSEPVIRVLELAGIKDLFPVVGTIPDAEPDPDPAS